MASDRPASKPVTPSAAGINFTIAVMNTGGLLKVIGTGLDLIGFVLATFVAVLAMACWSVVFRWAMEQFGRSG